MKVLTPSGFRYFLSLTDDASSYHAAIPLCKKSDAFDAWLVFKAYAEKQTGKQVKFFQDDKGGEYMSNAFIKFTDECGIERRHTVRNRPQQNYESP